MKWKWKLFQIFLWNKKISQMKENKEIKCIYYERVQLVFVLIINDSDLYTVLVNQLWTKEGINYTENNNLILLNKKFN